MLWTRRTMIAITMFAVANAGCTSWSSRRSAMRDEFAAEAACPLGRVHTQRLLDRIERVYGCGEYVDYAQQWSVSWRGGQSYPSRYGGSMLFGERTRSVSHRWLRISGVDQVAATTLGCATSGLYYAQRSPTYYDVEGCGHGAAFELQCIGMTCGWVSGEIVPTSYEGYGR